MKKIALISDGWRRLITYAWVDGILNRIRRLGEDIALFQYNSYGNWSKDELHNIGEYNIYNLPKLEEFDGIIFDSSNVIDEDQRSRTIEKLRASGRPVVTIEHDIDGFYYVGANNRMPIVEIVHHLYEEHGCRKFVFAGGPADAYSNKERVKGFRQGLTEVGLDPDEHPVLSGDYDYETGVAYMQKYCDEKLPFPDVFVCANDNIAAGMCAEAENHGYRVPDDFRVTGFDNLDKAMYFRPQITTVWQNRSDIGAMCVETLMRLWDGEKVGSHTFVTAGCIYAESCGCPNTEAVEYREYIRNQIVYGVKKDEDDALLVDLEAEMAKHTDFAEIFNAIVEYFQKLECDGLYIVTDRKLFDADVATVFPQDGYDWDDLVVADGFDEGGRTSIKDVDELNRHLDETGSGNAYIFTPMHFREQAIGYIIMKNGRFLYDNPYYYDVHCTIVKAVESQFRQNQLRKAVQRLQDLYNRDPLTGIYNRIAYTDMIRSAFANYTRIGVICALVFVDADDFKSVNDTYGHDYGDHVLKRIASTLDEECPDKGYVCRYGGDEFIGFFPYATPASANHYAETVESKLLKENIKISIGIQLSHGHSEQTVEEVLSLADQNMYEHKQAKKRKRAEEAAERGE
ncbi:MAG: GGDEF domain-containing protein [Clostridiales bacterium]|nr:GGDEF domain-containing protein [Clostridiales bacterium]